MLATRLRQLFSIGLLTCGLIGVGSALAQQLGGPAPADPGTPFRGVALDPLAAPDAQPKPAEPKKIVAKGIEDDDVPYGSFPAQAVVRIEDGKLIVRERSRGYIKTTNGTTVVQRFVSHVVATAHDPADVAVFDMKGNRLAPKDWKAQLKTDVHALVAHDGKLPNPRELTLFKADTLLIVLPAPVAAPMYSLPAVGGAPFYPSAAPTAPAARAGSAFPANPALVPPQSTRPATPNPVAPRAGVPFNPPTAPTPTPPPSGDVIPPVSQ